MDTDQAKQAPGLLKTLDTAFVAANRWVLILGLGFMSVIVFANVMLRYLTDESIMWSEEVARYLMIWLTFLGVGPVLRLGGHIAIETLPEALPAPAARRLRVLILVAMVVLCVAMIWAGMDLVSRTRYQMTAVTDVPFSLVAAAIPTGFALALVHLAAVARGFVASNAFEVSQDIHRDEAGSL